MKPSLGLVRAWGDTPCRSAGLRRRTLLTGAIAIAVLSSSLPDRAAAEQGPGFPAYRLAAPRPSENPYVQVLEAELRRVIAARDERALLAMVAADVLNSFGGDGGKTEFRRIWGLNRNPGASQVWRVLADVTAETGVAGFEDDRLSVAYPRESALFPDEAQGHAYDPFAYCVVRSAGAPLRSRPESTASPIPVLGGEIVNAGDHADRCGSASGWVRVETSQGRYGYVAAARLVSPVGWRARFERRGGRWLMTALLAGD